jgi:Ras-related protein Rab-8A
MLIKVIIIGDSGVGKTNVLTRYCEGIFKDSYVATIGVDFKIKVLNIDDTRVKLQIWDTAGQERFRNITTTYFKGAAGIILVYSIDNYDSFRNINNWMKQI